MSLITSTLRVPMKGQTATKTYQQLDHERIVAMKGLLLGMMCCMAAGAETLILIPDGPITVQQQFVFGLICGSIGTFVGLAMWEIPQADPTGKPINPLKAMSRQGVANLGLAALLGPTLAAVISRTTGLEITVPMLAPISGILGIGGSAWFSLLWPYLLEQSTKRAKKRIDRALDGISPDDTDA